MKVHDGHQKNHILSLSLYNNVVYIISDGVVFPSKKT